MELFEQLCIVHYLRVESITGFPAKNVILSKHRRSKRKYAQR